MFKGFGRSEEAQQRNIIHRQYSSVQAPETYLQGRPGTQRSPQEEQEEAPLVLEKRFALLQLAEVAKTQRRGRH